VLVGRRIELSSSNTLAVLLGFSSGLFRQELFRLDTVPAGA
jgi:hypothetical protein